MTNRVHTVTGVRRRGSAGASVGGLPCLLALVLGLVLTLVVGSPAPARAAVVFADEFTGTAGSSPDPSRWVAELGGGTYNGELQCYTGSTDNARLDGAGNLLLVALRAPGTRCSDGAVRDYTSARLDTRATFTYGAVEMRAKMPTAHGMWPAFWALGADMPQVSWPRAGEIDIAEVIGSQPTVHHVAVHGPLANGRPYAVEGQLDAGVDLARDFHVYRADWAPGSITFSFDGRVVRTVTPSSLPRRATWVFDHPFHLLLNVAVGGSWPGPPDAGTTWPQVMTVDYVRVTS